MVRSIRINKRRSILVLILLLISISMGYAYLSAKLNIGGNSNIKGNKWDIHFENIDINSKSVSASNPATIEDENKQTVTYDVKLDKPGDFYEFNVDVVNKGTIDAKLGDNTTLIGKGLTDEEKKFASYSVKYTDGSSIEIGDKLPAGGSRTVKVKVEYRRDINASDLPSDDQEGLSLTFGMHYIQDDESNDKIEYSATAARTLKHIATDGSPSLKSDFAKDDTSDGNLRYIGSDPNNYVSFNNESGNYKIYANGNISTGSSYIGYNNGEEFPDENSCLNMINSSSFQSLKIHEARCSLNTDTNKYYIYGKGFITITNNKDGWSSKSECESSSAYNNFGDISCKKSKAIWRIVGVMNNIDDGTGMRETRMKLVRDASIGKLSWKRSDSSYNDNDWEHSDLMLLLNSGAYWNKTSGSCYKGEEAICDFSSNGLSKDAKAMIGNAVWNLGNNPDNNYNSDTSLKHYLWERSSVGNLCVSGSCNGSSRKTKWTGKVGLIYPSDSGYATGGGSSTDRSTCLSTNMYDWGGYSDCYNNNWIIDSYYPQFSISPVGSNYYNHVFLIYNYIFSNPASSTFEVRPSVYLKSSIKIVSGTGREDDPYILSKANDIPIIDSLNTNTDNNNVTVKVGTSSDVSKYYYSIDGTDYVESRDSSYKFSNLDDGEHIVRVYIKDRFDNKSDVVSSNIRIFIPKNLSKHIKNLNDEFLITDDGTDDHNSRYIGRDPDNYVSFNDELWRVIGVFNNIDGESRVKIIRSNSIGSYSWDSSESSVNNGYGINEWSQADLMKELNSKPYWRRGKGVCYRGYSNYSEECDFSSIGITDGAKKMINKATWNLGSIGENYSDYKTSTFYEHERGGVLASSDDDGVERHATWKGRIGLMYPSDFGFATDGGSVGRSECLGYNLSNWSNYYECYNNDWLYDGNYPQQTITPYAYSSSNMVIYNYPFSTSASSYFSVRPVVYLSSNVKVVDGSGKRNDPYELYIDPNDVIVEPDTDLPSVDDILTTVSDDSISVDVSASDDSSKVVKYYYSKDNGETYIESDSSNYTFTGLEDGDYTIKVYVMDEASNKSPIESKSATVFVPKNMNEYIKSKVDSSELIADDSVDSNIRYIGFDPDNYVEFNGELWRIIGLMNNVSDGKDSSTRIKIVRYNPIGNYSWDSSDATINNGYGINEWSQADLMSELNDLYYNKKSGLCYDDYDNHNGNCNFSNSGLSDNAHDMIDDAVWYLGSNSDDSWKSNGTANGFYNIERGNGIGKICSNSDTCNDDISRSARWTGRVGLIYPSDYGYATSGGNNTNRSMCLSTSMYDWDSYEDCYSNDWLYKSTWYWTMNPNANSSNASSTFRIADYGSVIGTNYAEGQDSVFPVVYLKASTKIYGGHGTKSSPYKLSNKATDKHDNNDDNPTISSIRTSTDGGSVTISVNAYDADGIEGYYYSKDNGDTYIRSDGSNYTFTGLSKGNVSISVYVMDKTGNKSKVINRNIKIVIGEEDNYIVKLSKKDKANLVYDDGTVDHNTRYIGRNPDNYIMFNNELWRIVGVFNNIVDDNGKKESRIKLIRNDVYPKVKYGDSNDYSSSNIKSELNEKYYNNFTSSAKGMIGNVVWNLGGPSSSDYFEKASPIKFYGYERESSTWTGKVGLMYPSDYGYATSGSINIKRRNCINYALLNWNDDKYSDCRENDYLYDGNLQWVMNPVSYSYSDGVYRLAANGRIKSGESYHKLVARAVVYLNPSVIIESGTGSKDKPYIIKGDNSEKEYNERIRKEKEEEEGKKRLEEEKIKKEEEEEIDAKDGLVEDDNTSDHNKRYVGSNPNNYVMFNNELWRIIGTFNNIDNGIGIKESRIKLVKDDYYSTKIKFYDKNVNDYSVSTLKDELNGEYLNSLSSDSLSMIDDAVWYLGGPSEYGTKKYGFTRELYKDERSNNVYDGHATSWTGKVGLIYASDYGFASGGGSRINRNNCLKTSLDIWFKDDYSECRSNNYLYDRYNTQWTITPFSKYTYRVLRVTDSGRVTYNHADYKYAARPSVYLKSGVIISGGSGTHDNPYKLSEK